MGSWINTIVGRKKSNRSKSFDSNGTTNQQESEPVAKDKRRRWSLWKSSRASVDEESDPADEKEHVAVPNDIQNSENDDGVREELAAIRIQTAFRGYLARRTLRALKGLTRLQASINRNGVRKQSVASLRPIRDFIRIQAQIHSQRALKRKDAAGVPQKLPGNTIESCQKDSEAEWCDAVGTLEEIQAKVQQRQEAAIKRERAMAYAFSNQWRINSTINSEYLFDYELDNSRWSWIWLDRWISSRVDANCLPKEGSKLDRKTKLSLPKTKKHTNSKVVNVTKSESNDSTPLDARSTTSATRKPAARKRSPKVSAHTTTGAEVMKPTEPVTDLSLEQHKLQPTEPDMDLSSEQHKIQL